MANTLSIGGAVRKIALATLIAGTLDICSAFVYSAPDGRSPIRVLQGVASALLGRSAVDNGIGPALIGLLLHFAIMTVMVTVFVVAAQRTALPQARPILSGIAYGLGLWIVMYWIVLPLRWPGINEDVDMLSRAEQLFSHIVLVGIPIALIARR